MPKQPAVRDSGMSIQIDAKRGQWPFVQLTRLEDGGLVITVDMNESGQVIGEGRGVAVLRISAKKAEKLLEFLERTAG